MSNIIINVTETFSYIKVKNGIKLDDKLIDKACSFEVPNAKYSDRYKNGDWDGRYRLYDKIERKFPTGMLRSVIDVLDMDCYDFEINYLYKEPEKNKYRFGLINLDFRDYQTEAITRAIEEKRGILNLATGSGKTLIALGIIVKLGIKTLFLVHTKDLLYQTYNKFRKHITNARIGIIGDGNIIIGDINVATVQTIASKINESYFGDYSYDTHEKYGDDEDITIKLKETDIPKETFENLMDTTELVFWDETHHLSAQTFYKTAMRVHAKYRFGLSATPYREDGFDMKIESGTGRIIYSITTDELIKRGYLAKPNIIFYRLPPKHYAKKIQFQTVYNDYIVENPVRNEIIKECALNNIKKGNQILIIVKQLRHMNTLNVMIPNSEIIYGELSADVREDILTRFRHKEIKVLIGTTILDEGLDVPTIDTVIIGSGGKSRIKTIQRVGRSLRLSDICPKCGSVDIQIKSIYDKCICEDCGCIFDYAGKTNVNIYDFYDNTARWLFDHANIRKTTYESEHFQIGFANVRIETK